MNLQPGRVLQPHLRNTIEHLVRRTRAGKVPSSSLLANLSLRHPFCKLPRLQNSC